MLRDRKILYALSFILLVGTLGLSIYWLYLAPKLSLFSDRKRAKNFRSMDKIFPLKWIRRSPTPQPLQEKQQNLNVSYIFEDKSHSMSDLLARSGTTGILVVKDDAIAYEQYFQGNTPNSRNTSWSVAKSFVSALVGIAIAEGHIGNVNEPITKYLPELAQSGYRNVPIAHILQMSSGVKFSEGYADDSSDVNHLLPQLFLQMRPLREVVLDFPSEQPSGRKFHYISLDTQVLGMLVARSTGQSIAVYAEKKLWQPLGAESDAFWSTDNYGTELAFCCLNATLRDYAKFGMLYLHEGYFRGKQIVPKAWVRQSIIPDRSHLQVGATDLKEYGGWGYQYQWWIPTGSTGDYLAAGILGQYIYIDPKTRVVIVKTSSGSMSMTPKDDDEAVALFRAIAKALK